MENANDTQRTQAAQRPPVLIKRRPYRNGDGPHPYVCAVDNRTRGGGDNGPVRVATKSPGIGGGGNRISQAKSRRIAARTRGGR